MIVRGGYPSIIEMREGDMTSEGETVFAFIGFLNAILSRAPSSHFFQGPVLNVASP
jgi:hypothetical protein